MLIHHSKEATLQVYKYPHKSYRYRYHFSSLFCLACAGSSPVLPQTFQTRKQMSISPLATHGARAASSPAAGGGGRFTVTPKFFEKGVGTQVMLSSSTSSPAKELLFDKARRLLEEDEVDSLKDNVQEVCITIIMRLL